MKYLLLLTLLLFAGCASNTTTVTKGVPNLRQIDANAWRGGQPSDEGWTNLQKLGVTRVIKLNEASEGSDDTAKALGMTVFNFPITPLQQTVLRPGNEIEMAAMFGRNPKLKCFIHCEHGQDRTGLVVAIGRVNNDHWTKAQAEQEMISCGFHKELHGLWDWWEDWKP